MNPVTGEIEEFKTWLEAEREGYAIALKREPNPKCHKCYGCGYVGKNDQGRFVPCTCTQ